MWKLASQAFALLVKNNKNIVKMQGFSPSAQNRQLPKCSPRPFSICFSQSRTLSCFFIKKWAFHLQARKHCKHAGKTLFLGARALKKNTLLRHLLLSRAQTSYPSRPTSCPYPFLGPRNWFFKPNNILPLPFSAHLCPPPQDILNLHPFCAS